MSKKMSLLLSLGLALLLSLGSGCKAAPEKSVVADVPAGKTAPGQTAANPQAATPATSPAAPAQPGQPAPLNLPGAPATAAKPGTALSPDKIPGVVCRVNGKEIKKAELIDGTQMVQVRMAQMGQRLDPTADLYRKVLDELISIHLLQQDATAQGVTVSDQEVQQMVDSRKRGFKNDEDFKKALAQAGVTENDLRQRAREQLMLQRYVETKIAPKATVSDQMIRDFYDKHKDEMKVPERLRVRHVLIAVDPKATPADRDKARQKAQDVLKRVQAGEDFGQLAAQYSDDPGSKSRGGEVGPIAKGQTVPPFEAAAFALQKPNDLSPVVETQYGFHVIQLIERQAPSVLPYDQVKDRIGALLKQQEVQKMFQDRAAQLRAKSKVEIFL